MNVQTTIMIATMDGNKNIEATIVTPGLAVHEERGNSFRYVITHIGSGLQVLAGATLEDEALSAARALGKLTDWEQSENDIVAAMQPHQDEVVRIARKAKMTMSHKNPVRVR